MNRPTAFVVASAALLLAPLAVGAAQAPDASLVAAFSGTWRIDQQRSEPLPATAGALASETVLVPRRVTTTTIVSSGGAPPTSGRGRRGAPNTAPPPTVTRSPGAGPGTRRYLRNLAAELAPPPTLAITISDTEAVLANTAGAEIRWTTDGNVHQEAQMDGTMLEQSARWKGDKLELHDAVHGAIDLKRELRLIDDGTALEMKIELGGQALRKKITRKVVYIR